MTCADVMTRDPVSCELGESAANVAKIMKTEDVGSVPVCFDLAARKLVGIVTDRDITLYLTAQGREAQTTQVATIMTRDPLTCHPEDDLRTALEAMERGQVRRIPVVNDNGQLVGIISLADVMARIAPDEKAEVVEQLSKPAPAA
ncbi:MAG: CBS domain-containing protein [Ignavibacteriota bacterium]